MNDDRSSSTATHAAHLQVVGRHRFAVDDQPPGAVAVGGRDQPAVGELRRGRPARARPTARRDRAKTVRSHRSSGRPRALAASRWSARLHDEQEPVARDPRDRGEVGERSWSQSTSVRLRRARARAGRRRRWRCPPPGSDSRAAAPGLAGSAMYQRPTGGDVDTAGGDGRAVGDSTSSRGCGRISSAAMNSAEPQVTSGSSSPASSQLVPSSSAMRSAVAADVREPPARGVGTRVEHRAVDAQLAGRR